MKYTPNLGPRPANLPAGFPWPDGIEIELADRPLLGAVPVDQQRVAASVALLGKAANALAANATFLANASPTNAQTLAQVRALTRKNNALIRLLLGIYGRTGTLTDGADT